MGRGGAEERRRCGAAPPADLSTYAPSVSNGYARVSRLSGGNFPITYAVVNDGAAPGDRTGDGAFVPMDLPVRPGE